MRGGSGKNYLSSTFHPESFKLDVDLCNGRVRRDSGRWTTRSVMSIESLCASFQDLHVDSMSRSVVSLVFTGAVISVNAQCVL